MTITLSSQQQKVLKLRAAGLSYAGVGAELGFTRQRAHQIEREALAAMGVSLSSTQSNRLEYGTIYRDRGRTSIPSDFTWTPSEVPPASSYARIRQQTQDWNDKQIDRIIAKLESGSIRAGEAWSKIVELI